MGSVDPLRITVDEERHAVALAQELIGVSDLDLHPERDRWVVSLRAGHTDNLVVRVLDAVRRSLAGEPTASALVTLDGHEYHMQGAFVTANRDWERDGSTIAYGIRGERSGEDIFVVSLAGEHDLYTAPKVQEELRSVIAAGARNHRCRSDRNDFPRLDDAARASKRAQRTPRRRAASARYQRRDSQEGLRDCRDRPLLRFLSLTSPRRGGGASPHDQDERASPVHRKPDTRSHDILNSAKETQWVSELASF
jgi:hypothetical protein